MLPYSDKITFNDVDLNSNIRNKKVLRTWIIFTILSEKKTCGTIDFNFCSDEKLLEINREYLQHDYYTDIITFDFTEKDAISGDIYISLDRVKDNSKTLKTIYADELSRVIIHGVLHLCGYKDKTNKQVSLMREKEEYYLSLL